jgi:hypothetical protein
MGSKSLEPIPHSPPGSDACARGGGEQQDAPPLIPAGPEAEQVAQRSQHSAPFAHARRDQSRGASRRRPAIEVYLDRWTCFFATDPCWNSIDKRFAHFVLPSPVGEIPGGAR